MKPIVSLSAIISGYDALLLDLWGVVHDGTHLYPGVHSVLQELAKSNKRVMFVSNAPRRSHKAQQVLAALGIEEALYQEVITSGELGYRWLAQGKAPFGKRYFYIGPPKDADILNGLDFARVDDIKQADFLLNVGFGSESESNLDWEPLLRGAKTMGLPMLCLNPDLEVVKQSGARFACAGVIGQSYARMGGSVTWFGKPYPELYSYCLEQLAPVAKSRILAIGDSLDTDIPGALNAGIDCVLITGGILKQHSLASIEAMCMAQNLRPQFIMNQLAW